MVIWSKFRLRRYDFHREDTSGRHIPLSFLSKPIVKQPKRNEPSSSRGESYSPTVIHPVHAVLDESENQPSHADPHAASTSNSNDDISS